MWSSDQIFYHGLNLDGHGFMVTNRQLVHMDNTNGHGFIATIDNLSTIIWSRVDGQGF